MDGPTGSAERAAGDLRGLADLAAELGLASEALIPHGRHAAKVDRRALPDPTAAPRGQMILVTAVTPTKHGEGKTVTAIGLADALRRLGHRATLAVREPSMGPLFGLKGGGTGGGACRVEPHQAIDLHFTGDLHAITSANNLMVAMADGHRYHGNPLDIDPAYGMLARCLDVDDRQLRQVITGLGTGGKATAREEGVVITAASETMASFTLAEDLSDLRERLARTVVGWTSRASPVTARDIEAHGAATALLAEALQPNLVQTRAGTPALVHAGPFANLAPGHNSIIADRLALARSELLVTEAGFGSDLGLEHFMHLIHPSTGLAPALGVLVVTVRALLDHDPAGRSLDPGFENLEAHLRILDGFGIPAVVALNRFPDDEPETVSRILEHCQALGVPAAPHTAFQDGGAGAEALATRVTETLQRRQAHPTTLYAMEDPPEVKLEAVARGVYGADGVELAKPALETLDRLADHGYDRLPICIAKTPLSLSDQPDRPGAPSGWTLRIRGIELFAGAGYLVALAGDIQRMPGLPSQPAAGRVDVRPDGTVTGLG